MARLGNLLALLTTALLATESLAAKRTFAKKKGKTQMWITIIVVVGTVATRAEMVPSDAEINANRSSRTGDARATLRFVLPVRRAHIH